MTYNSFSDFTEEKYKEIIVFAKKKYKFIFYNQIKNNESFLLWRHDVDFSVNRALSLAKIEQTQDRAPACIAGCFRPAGDLCGGWDGA